MYVGSRVEASAVMSEADTENMLVISEDKLEIDWALPLTHEASKLFTAWLISWFETRASNVPKDRSSKCRRDIVNAQIAET